LIRRIPIIGDSRGFTVILEDQAEALFLSDGEASVERQYQSFLYRNLRAQWMYRKGENVQVYQFRTRGGTHIPIVVKSVLNHLGFLVTTGDQLDRSMKAQINSFLAKVPESKIVVTGPHMKTEFFDTKVISLPLAGLI
jgi:predicted AAA+ superfamily ATPase